MPPLPQRYSPSRANSRAWWSVDGATAGAQPPASCLRPACVLPASVWAPATSHGLSCRRFSRFLSWQSRPGSGQARAVRAARHWAARHWHLAPGNWHQLNQKPSTSHRYLPYYHGQGPAHATRRQNLKIEHVARPSPPNNPAIPDNVTPKSRHSLVKLHPPALKVSFSLV